MVGYIIPQVFRSPAKIKRRLLQNLGRDRFVEGPFYDPLISKVISFQRLRGPCSFK